MRSLYLTQLLLSLLLLPPSHPTVTGGALPLPTSLPSAPTNDLTVEPRAHRPTITCTITRTRTRTRFRTRTKTLIEQVTHTLAAPTVTVTVTVTLSAPNPAPPGIDVGEPNPSTPPPTDPITFPGQLSEGERFAILSAHNDYRSDHSSPPLTWSPSLALSASALASPCIYPTTDPTTPFGSNTAYRAPTLSVTESVSMWYNEITNYDYTQPGYTLASSHFTQLIWRATTQLGCVKVQCQRANLLQDETATGLAEMVWCLYDPKGNVAGTYE